MHKKIAAIFLLSLAVILSVSIADNTHTSIAAVSKLLTDSEILTIRASDKIITYYRTCNRKKQYRRWNEIKQCWVDPDWIDMP